MWICWWEHPSKYKHLFVCAIVRKKEIAEAKDVIVENICAIIHEKNKKDAEERRGLILK